MTAENPRCPHCGKADDVRLFADVYTVELYSSGKGAGFDPFDLFTSSSTKGNNSDDGTFDLVGGCLVAIVGFVTIPLRSRVAAKRAPEKERREREQKAERLKWRDTLATWPTIYVCKRDRLAFLPGEGRGAPAASVFRLLQSQGDSSAVTKLVQGL